MSHYIRILNKVKLNIGKLSLTPEQISCQGRIEERLVYPGVVNLFGLHGVGKTVLGWALNDMGKVVYVVHPTKLNEIAPSQNITFFLDNVNSDRASFRYVMGRLESLQVDRAVLVTHHPANDYVFHTEMKLNSNDVEIVRENLRLLGYSSKESDWKNLWHGVIQIARKVK